MRLRPYQRAALVSAKAEIDAGRRRVCLVSPGGSGKTVTGAAAVAARVQRGQRVVWFAHRRELMTQAADTLRRFDLAVGVFGVGASAPVQIRSAQESIARGEVPPADFGVIDECVVGDTMIGGRRADSIEAGDMVPSWSDAEWCVKQRRVLRRFENEARSLRTITVGSRLLTVTDAHPIWIGGKGWTYAKDVRAGDLCRVWEADEGIPHRSRSENVLAGVLPGHARRESRGAESFASVQGVRGQVREGQPPSQDDLLGGVREHRPWAPHGEYEPTIRLDSHAGEKPDGQTGKPREGGPHVAHDGSPAAMAWREGPRSHGATAPPGICAWLTVGDGISATHQGGRTASVLHLRGPGEPIREGLDRGGRPESRNAKDEGIGREAGRLVALARVDRVEVHEPGSDGSFGGRAPGGRVYNFEVDGDHNFFANGILTHNCHHYSADLWKTIPDAYPDADLLGLTATPERGDGRPLDHLFNALVVVAQPEDMVDLWRATEGRSGLVPCHVERPNRALKGLARSPAKATMLHKLRDHQQICFAPHVLAGELYVAQFREIGVSVEMVTGKTPVEERDAILARFAERKTRVVVNCQVLTEGWDCPAVDVVTLGGPCSSVGSLIQKATRGSRPAPGKTRFVVLDLPGCTWTLGHPFEDREYSLEGRGISTGKKLVRLDLCKRCGDAMPDDGDTCSREGCGWTRPALEVPKVLEERLERWEWRRQMATDERVTKMVQWMRAAMHKGLGKKATGIAIHTYRGYFHDGDPSAEIIRHACAIVGNRPWCSTCNHSVREGRCQCPIASILTSNAETGT